MKQAVITVERLNKIYRVPERPAGAGAAFKSLWRREYRDVAAVREVSFEVTPGEMVALLGANGAGKTTTLKMLSGLLHPSSGSARVAGYTPWQRHPAYLQQISMVAGNKSQLNWDIPPLDSFHVLGDIYGVPPQQFRQRLDELVALLEMEPLLQRPVRNLSLGERMKCELVASLLHGPRLLFLDEPTLGLDLSMQRRLRQFIAAYNRQHETTVLLTSHYMADVLALCPRVLLIHQGQLLYDGGLQQLAERLAPFKLIHLSHSNGAGSLEALVRGEGISLLQAENGRATLRVRREQTPALTARLLQTLTIADLTVEDPPVESVIDQIYEKGVIEA